MAITNAQQYQQLVKKRADGERPGYVGSSYGSSGYQGGMRGNSGYQGSKGDGIADNTGPGVDRSKTTAEQNLNTAKAIINSKLTPTTFNKYKDNIPFGIGLASRIGLIPNKQAKFNKAIELGLLRDLGKERQYYDDDMVTPEFFDTKEGENLLKEAGAYPGLPEPREKDDFYIPPIPVPTTTGLDTTDAEAEEPKFNTAFRYLADGGRAGLAEGGMPYEGGIMDLESGRQQYFLGKLVKKATRAVKKIAKSPIGKAALGYALTGGLGNLAGGSGLSGAFKGFMSPEKFLAPSKLAGIFSGNGLRNIAFGAPGKYLGSPRGPNTGILTKGSSGLFGSGGSFSPFKAIGLTSLASGLMTPEQEDEDETLYQGADIDDPRYIMANAYKYTNPRLMAEGGSTEAEPVAKKTMPLLDMDGQEMDLRAEGGFVPLGRMEKADDVPARLSKNEFVFTADAVRNAGEGDIDKGAEVMYNMMKNLESGGEVSEESQGLEGAREMFQTSQRLEEVI